MSVLAAACGRRIYAAEAATATEAQAAACWLGSLGLFLLPMAAACWLGSLGLFLFRSTAPPMAEAAADHNKTGGTGENTIVAACAFARVPIYAIKAKKKKYLQTKKKKDKTFAN